MGNSLSKEQQEKIQNQIEELKESLEKEKQYYIKNKTNEKYNANIDYENYEEEIIEGESILDCDLENIERKMIILSLQDEILQNYEKIKNNPEFKKEINEIIEELKKDMKEQNDNFDKINLTINNLIEITKLEFKKETKDEREEIERI